MSGSVILKKSGDVDEFIFHISVRFLIIFDEKSRRNCANKTLKTA